MTEKPNSANTFPARLHVLLARDALTGLVIRRGPHQRVCTIGWDRTTDTFITGQWLKGRIDERICDLSPDGRHFIYHAMNGKWQSEMAAWTAISRAPYLKAIGLWQSGHGGLFLDDQTYWLHGRGGHLMVRKPTVLQQAEEFPDAELFGWQYPADYFLRLSRNGWVRNESFPIRPDGHNAVFEKRVHENWGLRKQTFCNMEPPPGKGMYFDRHQLYNPQTDETIDGSDWEWADLDRERLVWATGGKLFAAGIAPAGLFDIRELHDFNAMKFEPLAAPY